MDGRGSAPAPFGWMDGRMDGWMEGRQTGIAGGGQLHFEEEEEARRPPSPYLTPDERDDWRTQDGLMAGWGPGGWMDGWKGAKQELPAAANYTLKRKKRKRAGPLWMDGRVDGWRGPGGWEPWGRACPGPREKHRVRPWHHSAPKCVIYERNTASWAKHCQWLRAPPSTEKRRRVSDFIGILTKIRFPSLRAYTSI